MNIIMLDFLEKLLKSKQVPIILIVGGLAFLFLALFNIDNFMPREKMTLINLIALLLGFGLILWGAIWHHSLTKGSEYNSNNYHFRKTSEDNYLITVNQGGTHLINITYGNINNLEDYDKNTLVVLPANDKFDDQCIDDIRSTLGAFMNTLYPNGNEDIKRFIRSELEKRGEIGRFDIGNWIYKYDLRHNGTSFNIGIVAVTHLKEDGNIIAYTEDVISAFKGICKIVNEKRLSKIFIPLIGSGHGGLSPEVSLLCLLLSILERLRNEEGRRLREIYIVIYKGNDGKKDILDSTMKNIVKFALTHF
jgi:hypothetical protein